jgi:hypothetical protein
MSFEGTTNPVVTETAVSDAPEVEVTETPAVEATEDQESEDGTGEETAQTPADDLEEIEFEGEKVKVSKKVKEGLLRQADYTRKTQEVAELRKALGAQLESAGTTQKEYVEALADVRSYDAQLKRYENVDWATLEATNPEAANSHWRIYSQLKDARAAADKTATEKKQSLSLDAQRARATRIQEVATELQKILPEWAPDNEFERQLAKYGTANKLSPQDITDATLRNPAFLSMLNKARLWDDHKAKEANTKRIEKAQALKPAAEIGSRSATATKDPAKMSQAAYVKWRQSQG